MKYLVNIKNKKIFNGRIPRYENKRVLLWENKTPENPMKNGYVIKLNTTDYDEIKWYYCYTNNSIDIQISSSCLKKKSVLLNAIGYGNNISSRRILKYSNDNTYIAQVGKTNSSEDSESSLASADE